MDALTTIIEGTFTQSEGYFSIAVILACFVIGYVIKHYTHIANNYIPLILIGMGIIINTLLNLPVTEEDSGVTMLTVLAGAVSGLASSGLYETIAKSFGLKKEENEN